MYMYMHDWHGSRGLASDPSHPARVALLVLPTAVATRSSRYRCQLGSYMLHALADFKIYYTVAAASYSCRKAYM